ncbi:hypothetical protein [Staphylococcus simulans]|uniref:hypothetical protein n=1 Tax=Staphylococcus simulans TaxID=1286 RepID=UPI000D1EF1E3|nr:hypothetical protein [Staphylococcus simulans]PTJ36459.1 hypothetical protein BU024_10370 [Staphylococcus simulans]
MANVTVFNNILSFYLICFTIFYILRVFFKRSLLKHKYISASFLIKYGGLTLIATVVIPYLIISGYGALKTSQLQISSYANDKLMIGFLLIAAVVTAVCILGVIKRIVTFLYYLYLYFKLQQDTLPNNLRHAIFNKEYSSIVSYYKLISRSNQSVSISNEEMLTLTAALSKAGLSKDVEMLLEKNLFKQTMFDSVLPSSNISSYSVLNEDLTYNDKLKGTLKEHSKFYKVVYMQIIALAFVQLLMMIGQLFFDNFTYSLSTILVIIIAVLIICVIVIKYKKLKSIYESFSTNSKNIKIKKSMMDIILISCQAVIILTNIIRQVF